jgi:roadblock/LC7 domain-containing protein
VLKLKARVTSNNNDQFSLTVDNDPLASQFKIWALGAVGGGGGGTPTGVQSVTALDPVLSSGGINPRISVKYATAAQDGIISASNFTRLGNSAVKDGSNATGTWPISIEGFAATAGAVPWAGIVAKPTTIAGFGITDAYTKTESDAAYPGVNGARATGTWSISITGTAGAVGWAGITAKPTSIAGYGITDAYTKTESDERYPLRNGTNANGSWPISITGSAGIATKAIGVDDLNSNNDIKQWIGTQAQYDALGSWDAYTYYAITDGVTPGTGNGGTGPSGPVAWDDVTGKPATFPPSAHTHTIAQVVDLQTSLDAKAPTTHGHTTAQVGGLDAALAGKAPTAHAHAIADVTNLQTSLNGKAALNHNHAIGEVTGLQGALDTKLNASDNAVSSTIASTVTDNGAGASLKFWYGTEAQYTAIAVKDNSTHYFRSA